MATSTVENYVKQLYLEQQRQPGRLVPLGRLASIMSVVPGTATAMVKALADAGLAHYRPRAGARLTARGQRLAMNVVRRHRLVELFLVKMLGMDWSEVHTEAEVLEHAISNRVLERLDEILGHPSVDPHGDPIPTRSGRVARLAMRPLAECEAGECVRIERVEQADGDFLRFARAKGLVPGSRLEVLARDIGAAAITVRLRGDKSPGELVSMGLAAAARLHVSSA